MRKIFPLFVFFSIALISLLLTKDVKAESYNCNNRPSQCSDLTTYPADKCRSVRDEEKPFATCNDAGGCFFNNGSTGSGGPYCAFKAVDTPPTNYTCSNRDPKCPASTHDCKVIDLTQPFNCSRSTDCLSYDSNTNTTYCAYQKGNPPLPSCIKKGEGCNSNFGSQGDCCDGLVCNREGDETTGFCRTAPSDFGPTCYKCAAGSSWNGSKCVDSSGNEVTPESKNYCGTTGECEQGQGCISIGGSEPNAPLSSPCENPGDDGCPRIYTAFGWVSTGASGFTRWLLGFLLSISGGIIIIIIIISGYRLMTSQGDPEKIKNARDQLTAAIVGLLFIIFSLVILELITRDILGLPGFGS